MFVRKQVVRRGEDRYTYLRVVESTRRNGRVVQQTLVNLGSTAAWPPGKLEQVVRVLERFLGLPSAPLEAMGLNQVRVSECRQLGPYLALSALWDQLGLDALIGRALLSSKVQLPVVDYARAMVLHRLVDPGSKRAVHQALGQSAQMPGLGEQPLPLHGYYRALEHLEQIKDEVEKGMHLRAGHLFNRDLSLVFYDLTSSYFEGKGCQSACHGYSREHRPDCVQIEIGLLVDAEGVPMGHEVFPGNQSDATTVVKALERLKRDLGVERCVFVSDDGMASEANLNRIAEKGYEYITSLSLRKSLVARQILSALPPRRTFQRLGDNLWVQPLHQEPEVGVRYIGSYNPDRARASRRHRKEHLRACVAKLKLMQLPRRGPGGRGGRYTSPRDVERTAVRFVKGKRCAGLIEVGLDAQEQLWWRLDRKALRLERSRDGLMVLVSNSRTLSDAEVAVGYRSLWKVENAFRHLKDPIQLRPIRHWNEARVRGHVFVCVLAYMLERLMEMRLQKASIPMSAAAALAELKTMTVSTLTLDDQRVRRRSEPTRIQERILAALDVYAVPEVW